MASELRPIGVLGGVFDPVHYGHLGLAQAALALLNLAEVRFVPANVPPHRAEPQASTDQRVQMLKLAISANPPFVLDQREILRKGPSYTVDTLTAMRSASGAKKPMCLLVGADAFAGLATWHRWKDLFNLAHIAVARRPGYDLKTLPSPLRNEFAKRSASSLKAFEKPSGTIILLEIEPVDISASMIRERLAGGKNVSDLLPPLVLDYIRNESLYPGGG